MRRSLSGRSRGPAGRRRAVTSAGRISTGGTAAAAAICLVAALAAGHSVLRDVRPFVRQQAPPLTLPSPTASPRPAPSDPHPAVQAPVTLLARDVANVMTAQEGPVARRDYGTSRGALPDVQMTRIAADQSWAFGTAVIPVPPGSAAPPATAFFIADASGGRWQVALSGSAEFGHLITSASGKVVSPAEGSVLARFSAVQSARPAATGWQADGGLELPWRTGQSWRLLAAFSGSAAAGGPSSSMLAFAGGDGLVRAAGPGRLYRFCGEHGGDALIEILHPDGSATEYYELTAQTHVPAGGFVPAGAYLGRTGTSLACGGAAPVPATGKAKKAGRGQGHGAVAFAVLGPGGAMSLDGLTIGGWTFHADAHSVWAQHGKAKVAPGDMLPNLGAPGPSAPARKAAPATRSGTPTATGTPTVASQQGRHHG